MLKSEQKNSRISLPSFFVMFFASLEFCADPTTNQFTNPHHFSPRFNQSAADPEDASSESAGMGNWD